MENKFFSNVVFSQDDPVWKEISSLSIFPINIFPPFFQNLIIELWKVYRFPVDYTSVAILAAISLGMGTKIKLQVASTWYEYAVLWIAIVGKPGSNKSHPLTTIFKPLSDLDLLESKRFEQDLANYYSKLKNRNKEDPIPQKPTCIRRIVEDFTPESLTSILKDNKEGLLASFDELIMWVKNFSRYTMGSQEQFWLKSFSVSTIHVDRKKEQHPITLAKPFVTVIGGIQEDVISELIHGDRAKNGFVDRILFVYPKELKKYGRNKLDLRSDLISLWTHLIKDFVSKKENHTLQLTEEANDLVIKWQQENADLVNQLGSNYMSGIYNKLETYFYRFVAIIHVMRALGKEIQETIKVDVDTVNRAIDLVNYFRISNKQALKGIFIQHLSYDMKLLYEKLPNGDFELKTGLEVVKECNSTYNTSISESGFKRFLNNNTSLFAKRRHGVYYKL